MNRRSMLRGAVAALAGLLPGATLAPAAVAAAGEPATVRAPDQTPKKQMNPTPLRGQARQVAGAGYAGPALARFLFGPRGDRTDGWRYKRNQRERRRDMRRGGR